MSYGLVTEELPMKAIVEARHGNSDSPNIVDFLQWEAFVETTIGLGSEGHKLVHAQVGGLDSLCAIRSSMGHQT